MVTVVLEAPGRVAVVDRPEPSPPGVGEALVRVLRVGVCGTDLHAFAGRQAFVRYPLVPGHELGVEVVALGPRDPDAAGTPAVAVGDRCAVVPYLSDGTCLACRAGKTNCCLAMRVLGVHVDGGMQSLLRLPTALLMPGNDLSVDALALAEMLAVGAHAARRAGDLAGLRVLVVGAGPIGLATLAFVRSLASETTLYDLDPHRRAFAEALGLGRAVTPGGPGDPPDVVIDATGHRGSMEAAPSLVAHGGRVVFVGHTPGPLAFENPIIHGKELTLIASRNATRSDFDTVFAALRSGAIDPTRWITTRTDPAGYAQAVGEWVRDPRHLVKAILEWPDDASVHAKRPERRVTA